MLSNIILYNFRIKLTCLLQKQAMLIGGVSSIVFIMLIIYCKMVFYDEINLIKFETSRTLL